MEILAALDLLHREGLVHRDLKPSNIFLTPHGVKILDFGLARTSGANRLNPDGITESLLTQEGAIVGTPGYMAPEQLRGEAVDGRTDLFALGAMIFEMLTGKRAFPGQTYLEVSHQTLYQQPSALGGSPAAMGVDRVLRKVLAKNRDQRFSSAADMAEALRSCRADSDAGPVRAHRISRLIVLPFRVLRPDPDTDFLAVSVPDAIANSLSGLDSLAVRSSAAASRFAAEDLDLKRIAEEADVDVVLTGSFLRAGDNIRVTAQLLEVPGGTLLWSHAPMVPIRDVFQLQDQMVEHIVASLSPSLTSREQSGLKTDVPTSSTAYELFLRANQMILVQGVTNAASLSLARDLYDRCVTEDPSYAPAWARLGRCHWLIGKGGEDREHNVRRSEECFRRALELNPELPLAHNLYALLEIDQGRAQEAMVRLIRRGLSGGSQAELFAALVQACRFCGLLEASVAAHERAQQLDRNLLTSVDHTYLQLGDYDQALEYARRRYYGEFSTTQRVVQALIFCFQGKQNEGIELMREIEEGTLTDYVRDMVVTWRAHYEGNREESLQAAQKVIDRFPDPETVYWHARILANFGEIERALAALQSAFDRGFGLYRCLASEPPSLPTLGALRENSDFGKLLRRAELRYGESIAAFRDAGGEQLLGGGAIPGGA
jgi:TolB-like protein/tetratricopeptide (TPR) repeat protein